jgi:hypothetical protein
MRAVLETVWGLLVEDGSLAIGIVAALAATWILAAVLADPQRDQVGWVLLAMLVVLVVVNLRAAAVRARRHISGG